MVLIRTIILKLFFSLCLSSSLDAINLKIYDYQALPTGLVWLTVNQTFYFHIESDVELEDDVMECQCPIGREIKGKLAHHFEFYSNYEYFFSTNITPTTNMQGKWTCYVHYLGRFYTRYKIEIKIDVRVDVDECNARPSPCSTNANCTNTRGSYECMCLSGYAGDGQTCTDVNECLSNPCPDHAECHNERPGYRCICRPGFTGDGQTCTDVDECHASHSSGPCSPDANCTNTPGSYECTCLAGYTGNGTYCQASDEKHTSILVVIIVVAVIVVAAVVWLMVGLYKRRQKREKAIQSDFNFESLENTTERSMPPPAQWDNYSLPVNRQNENDTDTYSVPYQERNIEEMYAKPLPKSLREQPNTLDAVIHSDNPTYGNLSNQTAEDHIQPKKLIGNPNTPKILPTETPYSEVLPKSMRPNNESSKYVNVCDIQHYVNSDNGKASQDRREYAEPAYCEIGLKK